MQCQECKHPLARASKSNGRVVRGQLEITQQDKPHFRLSVIDWTFSQSRQGTSSPEFLRNGIARSIDFGLGDGSVTVE
jgi:hypothetical protein